MVGWNIMHISSYKKIGIGAFLVVSILLLGSLFYLFHDSYAIDTSSFSLPRDTFSSNYGGTAKTNLVYNALRTNATYASYLHNFEMATNFRDHTNSNPLYSMMKNLRFPTTGEKFELVSGNPAEVTDDGILYILSHGYNPTNTTNTIFTTNQYGGVSDNLVKQYITQMALWLYLFEHRQEFSNQYCIETKSGLSACDFYATGNNNLMNSGSIRGLLATAAKVNGYQYLNYIPLLVDRANQYNKENSSMLAIHSKTLNYVIAANGKSLVTEAITPSASENAENYMGYSIKLNDPNQYGAYLVDNDNNKLTNTTNLTGSFKIYVPLKEDIATMDLSSIRVDITGSFIRLNGYTYHVTTSNEPLLDGSKKQVFADILLGYVPIETSTVSLSLTNIVKISKVDAASSAELPGATLEVTDLKSGKVVDTWVSTTKPKYLYLTPGEYKLCETIAPDDYLLNTECITFQVDEKKVTAVTMKNNKKVEVPNTFANSSSILYLIGVLTVILGVAFIILTKKKSA